MVAHASISARLARGVSASELHPVHQNLRLFTGLFQPSHLLVLLVVVLVVFGPKRLPELGRSLGQGMRAFKSSVEGHHEGDEVSTGAPEPAREADKPPTSQH
jgi:sec-independent protein translocase protein TatA